MRARDAPGADLAVATLECELLAERRERKLQVEFLQRVSMKEREHLQCRAESLQRQMEEARRLWDQERALLKDRIAALELAPEALRMEVQAARNEVQQLRQEQEVKNQEASEKLRAVELHGRTILQRALLQLQAADDCMQAMRLRFQAESQALGAAQAELAEMRRGRDKASSLRSPAPQSPMASRWRDS